MSAIDTAQTRYQIEDTADTVTITIPSRNHWLGIVLQLFWLVNLTSGVIASGAIVVLSLKEIAAYPSTGFTFLALFGVFLLAPFALGGWFAAYTLCWMLTGREIVRLRPHSLQISRDVLGIQRQKEYDAASVTNLRAAPEDDERSRLWVLYMNLGSRVGLLAFDYYARAVRFGIGLNHREAQLIAALIAKRFPHYGQQSTMPIASQAIVHKWRFRVVDLIDGLTITIPWPMNWSTVSSLAGFFFVLLICAPLLSGTELPTSSGFSILMTTVWLFLLAFSAILTFLCALTVRDIITITDLSLRKGVQVLGISLPFSQDYAAQHITNFRISRTSVLGSQAQSESEVPLGDFWLAFDYGNKPIHFGRCANQAEAQQIYQLMVACFLGLRQSETG